MADTFLAVFTGSKTSPRMQAWMAMPEAEQKAKMQQGMAAWHGWMDRHKDILVFAGGPLGKTKKIGPDGIADISNNLSGFVLIRADSHHEAAKLFENHPHFAIFPGDTVEVMPVLPIPQG
ncbi:MAG: hypothetical protein JO256_05820 [Alphaproteobacteria bacterium]|nr:hypothetical protein [Alphaproteobacteria bacterium]